MNLVEMNRRHRGTILRIVRRWGVTGVSWEGIEAIFRQAGQLGAIDRLEENVQYLADKGYLAKELKRDDFSGVERWLVWITPRGIDLLDGLIEADPGVVVVS